MPVYRESLNDLLAAMQAGLDPQIGYSVYGSLQGQHQAQVQQRQANLQQLSQILTGAAAGGQTYDQAQALATAQSGGRIPPQADPLFEALYPTSAPTPSAQGSFPGPMIPGQPAQVSPLAPPPDPLAELAQQAQAAQYMQQIQGPAPSETDQLGSLIGYINQAAASGAPMDQIRQQILSDPEAAGIFLKNFDRIATVYPDLV